MDGKNGDGEHDELMTLCQKQGWKWDDVVPHRHFLDWLETIPPLLF